MEKKKKKKGRRGRPPKAKRFRDGTTEPYVEPKDRIKTVAIRLFYKKGFHGASIREIADAAEVTKPVIYYHYESKEGLYKFILKESMTEVFDIYMDYAGLIEEEMPCTILKLATKRLFDWIASNRERANMIIFTLATRDPAFQDLCEEYLTTRKNIMWPIFEKGIKEGNLPMKEPWTAYLAHSSLVVGLEMLSSAMGENFTNSENAKKVIDLLLGQCE